MREELHNVDSSAIRKIGYDSKKRQLFVEFKDSGEVYEYSNVSHEIYDDFVTADSKGRYFMRYVRDRYPYRRVR
jgi:hypothetical protein